MLTVAMARHRLLQSAASLEALVGAGDDEQNHWKPDAAKWSVHEVVCHLLTEETDDFRKRLQLTLEDPLQPWPPNDPESTIARVAKEHTTRDALAEFLKERWKSLQWLEEIGEVDLDTAHEEEGFPPMTAGTLLTSWVAHDVLHIRQITDCHWEYLRNTASPHSAEYAR